MSWPWQYFYLMINRIKKINTTSNLLANSKEIFRRANNFSFGIEAEILFEYATGITFAQQIAYPEKKILNWLSKKYLKLIQKRASGIPLAYLIGEQEFYGFKFKVTPDVLIPRPDTEILIETILKTIEPNFNGKIIDLGTGSGCIAITLAKKLSKAQIQATDISSKALKIARKNARLNKVKIKFRHNNLLENIFEDYDIIVANLPYIGQSEKKFISQEVLNYEPHLALFDGSADGLNLYRKLLQQIKTRAKKPCLIFWEIGFKQADEIKKMIAEFFPQAEISFFKDLVGIQRVVKIKN